MHANNVQHLFGTGEHSISFEFGAHLHSIVYTDIHSQPIEIDGVYTWFVAVYFACIHEYTNLSVFL